MDWLVYTLFSAIALGIYDLLKKVSLRDNPVPPVLFFGVVSGTLVWIPIGMMSWVSPELLPVEGLRVEFPSISGHLHLLIKSGIVGTSWIFAYLAVKHLPVSISGPIRATAPLWTILFATTFFGERPNAMQWGGVTLILLSFYLFSLLGKLEGIHFHRDKWVGFMVIATLIGASSALYDKWLLQTMEYRVTTVQFWFSIYLVVVLFPLYLYWRFTKNPDHGFHWRWSIPAVGIMLIVADAFYFNAVKDPDALISVITPVRRSSIFISFIGAVILFKEKNFGRKFCLILLLMAGLVLVRLGV